VLASYYHTASIYGDQVAASLLEPEALSLTMDQMNGVRRQFVSAGVFSGWMFSHDEIRVHGWDEAPTEGSPGQDLARNVRELERAAVGMDPAGEILIWSDMFDPFHNATPDATYYLVNGSWSGSWEGLGSRTVIVNWNSNPQSRRDSASFFAERGHRQILAGYYDSPPASFSDKTWLEDLAGVDGIDGVMYTPWSTGYDNLEAWASHVWGGAPWVTVGVSARVWLPVTSH
jgi:hypothetical protein